MYVSINNPFWAWDVNFCGNAVSLRTGMVPLSRYPQEPLTFCHLRAPGGRCDAALRQVPSRPLGPVQLATCEQPALGAFGGRGAKHLLPSPPLGVQLRGLPALPSSVLSEIRFHFPREQLPGPVTSPRSSAWAGGTGPRRDRARGPGSRAPVTGARVPRPPRAAE